MEVQIISRECIKPSSPTPPNLKTYKLSFLDQFIPSIYVPMALFYPKNNYSIPHNRLHKLLKESLSETLTHYYPLAGKIKDDLSIDCNDEGVYYLKALVNNIHLSEFLSQPNMISFIHKFFPCEPTWNESKVGAHVAMIQVNTFGCGGVAIAVYVSHMIVDGIALSSFLRDWAAMASTRGSGGSVSCSPNFDAPSRFPQNDSFPRDLAMMAMWIPFFRTGKCTTRRFVFAASDIGILKTKATSSQVQNPTRVQVVSALIWKCTMSALKGKSGFQKPSLLVHAVNLRRRAVPPLSEHSMGNFLWLATAQSPPSEMEHEMGHLVRELKKAITKIDGEFVEKLEGDRGFIKLCEALKEMGEVFSTSKANGVDFLGFSSWCNFGLYEVDFGWGKPVWVTSSAGSGNPASVFLNFVNLMDTKTGGGMEAWVSLDEQEMDILEHDMELLAFASLDPSPLQLGSVLDA